MRRLACLFAIAILAHGPAAYAESSTTQVAGQQVEVDQEALDVSRQILTVIAPPQTRAAKLAEKFRFLSNQVSASFLTDGEDPKFQARVDSDMQAMWQEMTSILARHIPDYYEAMARSYARNFTIPELRQILAFAQTPTGLKFLQSGSLIAESPEVVAVLQQMQVDLFADLPAFMKKKRQATADQVATEAKKKRN